MIRLENSYYLYGLLLIPFLILIFSLKIKWRKKTLKKVGDDLLLKRLMPDASRKNPVVKFTLLVLAYIFLIIGLANPQIGSKIEKVKRKGIDLMICLDVSNSMLAQDIKPNRLECAKQSISKLIDKLQGDRIGIIVFAGKAYTQLPITTDYGAAKMFLSTINTDIVPVQGTAISAAINLASKSFNNDKHNKAIVIITDGEDHEGDVFKSINYAKEKNIKIFTIGMGLPDGAPIPEYDKNHRQTGFKKNRQGNTIITKLNESMLQQIASEGKGIYVRANNSSAGLQKVFRNINKINKSEIESKMYTDYEDRFQYFIFPAFILLVIELLIYEKKIKLFKNIKIFKK